MLNYKITDKILNLISEVYSVWWVIEKVDILPDWEKQLKKIARIKSAVFSTRIEWSKLTLEDAESLEQWDKILARPRDQQEFENYMKVLKYIDKLNVKKISHKHIFNIHKIITYNILDEGLQWEYRQSQNAIYNSSWWIIYMPPEYKDVYDLMDNLLSFTNKKNDVNILIKASILHHWFVIIHPFIDWNWRTARALTQLFLYQNWFDTKKYFSLEEYYDNDLNKYYEDIYIGSVFYTEFDKWINSTKFIEYFLWWLLTEVKWLEKQVIVIKNDEKFTKLLQEKWLTNRQKHLVLFIQEQWNVKISELLNKFWYSRPTIKRELSSLLEDKILIKVWWWRSTFYKTNIIGS